MAWSLGFWHWNLAIAIFCSTPRDHILHGCRWLGHQQPQKKSICPSWLLGALWSLRSTELLIPSKEASITGRLFYQSQWWFLESKQLQIMEPSNPEYHHRSQNWTEDYEQGWTVLQPVSLMNCVKDNNSISLDGAGTSIAASETIWNALGFNVSGGV